MVDLLVHERRRKEHGRLRLGDCVEESLGVVQDVSVAVEVDGPCDADGVIDVNDVRRHAGVRQVREENFFARRRKTIEARCSDKAQKLQNGLRRSG